MALRSRIQEGYTLSDSLREHPRVFDSLFCSMVAAGEKSGHLDVVLNRTADYTEQRQRLKSRLLQAMLYPLVLLVVATGVVTILLTAVVPKIIEQFDHLGHALPASANAHRYERRVTGQRRVLAGGFAGASGAGATVTQKSCDAPALG